MNLDNTIFIFVILQIMYYSEINELCTIEYRKVKIMDNTIVSLLWPTEKEAYSSKIHRINPATELDLGLEELCKSITSNEKQCKIIKEIFANMCCDEEVIRYRQNIFEDFLHSEELIAAMGSILKILEDLQYITIQSSSSEEARLWKLFSRFKELEAYVDCVLEINRLIQGLDIKSEGLSAVRKKICDISEDAEFKALTDTVKSLNIELNEIQSITLGINLDASLNPMEATLVSVNKTRFIEHSWFTELVQQKTGIKYQDFGNISKIYRMSDDRRNAIMYSLYREINKLLTPVINDLSSGLKSYTHIKGYTLLNLIPEITFYLGCTRLLKKVKANGMPLCKPEISKIDDRKCTINNIYNINLALHMLQQDGNPAENMVLNNVNFDEDGRIFILTGPNRGGKTVYTEAVGLVFILFQAGIFVPGAYASMSPVDSILTHFPVDENQTVELGRLGEETKRLNEIFQEATKHSLILLNESLSSTSFSEGLFIAQDIVKALRYLGARVIFNTHMHELATYADKINCEVPGESKIISMVTGLMEGKRSYVILPGAPLGKSYAMDIAVKFGISYDQIVETINKNK